MLSFRQASAIFISILAITGAEEVGNESDLLFEHPGRAIANSVRSLNTFIALNPATAPNYFADSPNPPSLLPVPTVSSYPTASLPTATGNVMTPSPSSRSPAPIDGSSTIGPSRSVENSTSNSQTSPPSTAVDYLSISPLSTAGSTVPFSSQTLSPSAFKNSPTISSSSPAPAKDEPTSDLTNLPDFPVLKPTLLDFKWVINATAQPTSDGHSSSGNEELPFTPAPTAQLSDEDLNSTTPAPAGEGDEESNKNLSSYFETSIPETLVSIEFTSAMTSADKKSALGKLPAFFLELLASSPNSASFVTADLGVVVVNSSPLEVLVTGTILYARNDRPTTEDITAQLRTYFSFWGTDHLKEYLGSHRVSILLNGGLVSSHASERKSRDLAALFIILSAVLMLIGVAMFAFGVFTYRHVRHRIAVQSKQAATTQKASMLNSVHSSNIVATLSGPSVSPPKPKYEDADCESVAHHAHCKSYQYSVDDESKTMEEEHGLFYL